MLQKYVAEFVGTFALVFCGTGAIVIDQETGGSVSHLGIAATFGLTVMAMIYALGETSGAHFNPAVTVGFTCFRRFPLKQVLPYAGSQLGGAIVASLALHFLFPANMQLGATLPAGNAMQSFVLESLLTFFLMLVILKVATGAKEQGMFAGLAIGGTVAMEAAFAGPISGASMNPVRSFAPAVVSGQWQDLWVYLTAPFLGSLLAALLAAYLTPETDKQP